jgi:FdhE protein
MHADLDQHYRHLLDRIARLRQERSEYEEILAFYARVLAAQQEAQGETTIPELSLPEDRLRLKLQEGFCVIEREHFPVDRQATVRLLGRLCRLCLGENPVLAEAGTVLLEEMDSGRIDGGELITAVLHDDGEGIRRTAARLQVDSLVLGALTKLSLQPSLLAAKTEAARVAALDEWRHGYCPICGAAPAMAALVGEEGRRHAQCSFCGHLWNLPRVGCPFCTTIDKEALRYFYSEGEDLYRVQVCDHCRGYLKTLDTRKGGHVEALAADDIATAHLDLLAEQEGYQRKAPRLWGI